ncbi:MAG: M12 family metallo-peptidase, partial [Chloroflexota bacterium]
GDTTSPLTSDPYFVGHVVGDSRSFVFLAGGKSPRGMISAGGKLTVIAPDTDSYRRRRGASRLHTLTDLELEVPSPMRSWKCGAESLPEPPMTPEMRRALSTRRALTNTVYYASVAVETDYEYYARFGAVAPATQYVADLFAAVSAIYQRDVKVVLQVNYLSLWTTAADPWTATDSSGALNEYVSYWQTNRTSVPRSTAHMLSMRSLGGGIAYLTQICGGYGYGVSGNLNGTFSTTNPGLYWDIMVVSHELGHNFSSPHTQCYSPPVDMCYPECYPCPAGGCVVPPELGTIMSYCHTLGGGLNNIKLYLGVPGETSQAVTTKIRNYVEVSVAFCLGTAPGPTISGVSPPSGVVGGGTPVTISGGNFASGATVTIGGVAATGVTVVNSSSITATTGAHAASLVDVLVKNPDNQAFTATAAYTYAGGAATPTPTYTPTSTFTSTRTSTPTSTPSPTPVATDTPTRTPTVTQTTTPTSTSVATATPTATPTPTPTVTPTTTPTSTGTPVATASPTYTPTQVLTSTPTVTPTRTPTATPTPTSSLAAPMTRLYTLTPCRIADTRSTDSPALQPNATRLFTVTGTCGIPSTAVAISANVTVVATGAGSFTLYPGNTSNPGTSNVNFSAGRTRANNALLLLATDGSGGINVLNASSASNHFILDVNGYFQ